MLRLRPAGKWLRAELCHKTVPLCAFATRSGLTRISSGGAHGLLCAVHNVQHMGQEYRCVVTSVEGFVQQVASCYLRHGYWRYVCGQVPSWKDPTSVDAKLVAKYEIGVSESTRARRKRLGKANLQYLRHERFFVILATEGRHPFFELEAGAIRDIRRVPIKFHGYSISYRPGGRTRSGERDPRWHAHVEIARERYKEIRDHLLELARHRVAAKLVMEFYGLPFEPYAPVRRQMLNLLRAVNRVRKAAGFELLPKESLPLRRRVVRPFESAPPAWGSEELLDGDSELASGAK